jgi:hypothetical protein
MSNSVLTWSEQQHRRTAGEIYCLQCYLFQLGKVESLISLTNLYLYNDTELHSLDKFFKAMIDLG